MLHCRFAFSDRVRSQRLSINAGFYHIREQRQTASKKVGVLFSHDFPALIELGFELLPLLEDHRQHALWGAYVSDLLQEGKFTWPR
jgi:hypothetical protein